MANNKPMRWKVLSISSDGKWAECKCECGLVKQVRMSSITSGNSTQCRMCSIQNRRQRIESQYKCNATGYFGLQAWKRGCRCDDCKKQKSLRNAASRERKLQKDGCLWYSKRLIKANSNLAKLTPKRCTCMRDARRSKEESEKNWPRLIKEETRRQRLEAQSQHPMCDNPQHDGLVSYFMGCTCDRCLHEAQQLV